jgi:type III secretion protein R
MTGGTDPMSLIVVLGALAVLPFLLIMVTSFVKVAVVLSLVRQAVGAQQVPPNQVITGLAIVLSIYIMAPVGYDIYRAVEPTLADLGVTSTEADTDSPMPDLEAADIDVGAVASLASRAAEPLRRFLTQHADLEERTLLHELALELRGPDPARQGLTISNRSLLVLIPAFVVTELKEAFTIGFVLFVPFIIVDLVVANVLLSLGMHMLSPTTISLPFKLLLFVLVDGWFLIVKGLVLGYLPTT